MAGGLTTSTSAGSTVGELGELGELWMAGPAPWIEKPAANFCSQPWLQNGMFIDVYTTYNYHIPDAFWHFWHEISYDYDI